MKKKGAILFQGICTLLILFTFIGRTQAQIYTVENRYIARTLQVSDGVLSTKVLLNKEAGTKLLPINCDEFLLHLTLLDHTEKVLSNKDFKVISVSTYTNPVYSQSKGYKFLLQDKKNNISLTVCYELAKEDTYCRKHIEINSGQDIILKKIDVEAISFKDAYQNYTLKQLTAKGPSQWKPGLGQPVYTTRTATFWGIEFPASRNEVNKQKVTCGYLSGKSIKKGELYISYNSVVGVSDDPQFMDDAFYSYIDKIRKRPFRLQIQYNSWFDYSKRVAKENFIRSVVIVNDELVVKRHCQPLNAYIIDDGWEDVSKNADWSDKVWTINDKFQPDFSDCFRAVRQRNSKLGVWLSPGCLFGAQPIIPRMKDFGYKALSMGMSMTDKKYMQKLEERILELAKMGISYFKFDGIFGHLNIRDFDINDNPFPSSNDVRLNEARFDVQKEQYLVDGTEQLMQIFNKLHEVNPEIFIAITNGAYLSPWWLQYVDIVWLINAGDAAKGDDRTGELVYRDRIYHQIWEEENTKFPMNAIFNHEPKKTTSNEEPEVFRDYLFMNLSRGTGFVELYIKTDSLSSIDWDILADGLKWVRQVYPAFKHVRMHGGVPQKGEVYGYTAWTDNRGYLSIHNPSDRPQIYHITLDRKLGLNPQKRGKYQVSSPVVNLPDNLAKEYKYGETISLALAPKEVILLDFIR